MPGSGTLPPPVDLWAPVPFDDLPRALRDAAAGSDWPAVKTQLRAIMDSNTTDGEYGRELLQFVMKVPLPSDSVLDRYRASICIDHGDWDGLQRYLASDLIEPIELVRIRDIILAPLDRELHRPRLPNTIESSSSCMSASFSGPSGDSGDGLDGCPRSIRKSSGDETTYRWDGTCAIGASRTRSCGQ